MKKIILTLFCIMIAISSFNTEVRAYSGTYNLFHKSPEGSHIGLYKCDDIMYYYPEYGKKYNKYSGWVRTAGGKRRYYVTGDICKGWRKIKGKWYYFDYSNGNAVTGTHIIGGKKYVFNNDCSWSGKRSKSAKYPSDFSMKFKRIDMEGYTSYLIDGESKTLKITNRNGDTATKKMSTADVQVFYSMILDSGATNIKAPVSGFYIENDYLLTGYVPPVYEVEDDEGEPDEPADIDYWWTDPEMYNLEINYNGENYVITGDDTLFLFAYSDNTTTRFCHLIWALLDYVK